MKRELSAALLCLTASLMAPHAAHAELPSMGRTIRIRPAIKAVAPKLPVGATLAIIDDQATGSNSLRDRMRETLYGPWLRAARSDDFVDVQNYERAVWDNKGKVPIETKGDRNMGGAEVYPASLAGAVRYAHAVSGVPVIVTEHGVNTPDDAIRQRLIPNALRELRNAMAERVPVKGYFHWRRCYRLVCRRGHFLRQSPD